MRNYSVSILLASFSLALAGLCGCTERPYTVKGDTVTVQAPVGMMDFQILDISR